MPVFSPPSVYIHLRVTGARRQTVYIEIYRKEAKGKASTVSERYDRAGENAYFRTYFKDQLFHTTKKNRMKHTNTQAFAYSWVTLNPPGWIGDLNGSG